VDKSARKVRPKGQGYCDKPGTSCYYDNQDLCVNCSRPKGWRQDRYTAHDWRADMYRIMTKVRQRDLTIGMAVDQATVLVTRLVESEA